MSSYPTNTAELIQQIEADMRRLPRERLLDALAEVEITSEDGWSFRGPLERFSFEEETENEILEQLIDDPRTVTSIPGPTTWRMYAGQHGPYTVFGTETVAFT